MKILDRTQMSQHKIKKRRKKQIKRRKKESEKNKKRNLCKKSKWSQMKAMMKGKGFCSCQ
jgi:hypothetical protein